MQACFSAFLLLSASNMRKFEEAEGKVFAKSFAAYAKALKVISEQAPAANARSRIPRSMETQVARNHPRFCNISTPGSRHSVIAPTSASMSWLSIIRTRVSG